MKEHRQWDFILEGTLDRSSSVCFVCFVFRYHLVFIDFMCE